MKRDLYQFKQSKVLLRDLILDIILYKIVKAETVSQLPGTLSRLATYMCARVGLEGVNEQHPTLSPCSCSSCAKTKSYFIQRTFYHQNTILVILE